MPRTSTAESHHYVCPLCDQPLARDHARLGCVRHLARPDVRALLADPEKARLMSEDDRRFLELYKLCPLERGEKDEVEPAAPLYRHLGPRPGSLYQQYFVRDRRIRAETLYRQTVGPDGRSPEAVAADYDVPVEAVREAVVYCLHNDDLLCREREEELEILRSLDAERPRSQPASSGGPG
jgi:uncharacterized protein (DUF433 family)